MTSITMLAIEKHGASVPIDSEITIDHSLAAELQHRIQHRIQHWPPVDGSASPGGVILEARDGSPSLSGFIDELASRRSIGDVSNNNEELHMDQADDHHEMIMSALFRKLTES